MEKDELLATMGPFQLWSIKDSCMVEARHYTGAKMNQAGIDEAVKLIELFEAEARGNA